MFQPNSVIAGRYQVVRLVGQGGMSNLYLAYDRKYNNATVVVKEMTASYADPKEQKMAVDLFHREAKLLASLNHRHIPKVYDYFQFAGKYYLSMEYIDGVDLAIKLEDKKGPLEEKQVLEWGEQIAQVLFYLHKHDPPIVFRDVKPSNIMISSQGVKLIDFGIARHFDQAKKGDTMRIGSPGYAPPEQYAAQTDPRSDIYALGVTLHHALTGRDPTATSTPFLVPPARKLNPALKESTEAMLARATQLDPADRYQSALELKKDIKHILSQKADATRVVGAPPIPKAAPVSAQGKTAPTGTQAQATPAPAQAANSANPAQATPKAAQATPAAAQGSPAPAAGNAAPVAGGPAPTDPDATPSSPSGTLVPQAPLQSKKKKKSLGVGQLILATCLFCLLGSTVYLALQSAEKRDALLAQAKGYVESLVGEFRSRNNPENQIRDSLLSGNPEALLPLFQSSEFKELSSEKQELFRLNLLAAGSADGPLRIVHILAREGLDTPELWQTSALVVSSVNSRGGLGKELLVVVPETFKAGQLARSLDKLSKQKQESVNQSFLILGGNEEVLGEDTPKNLLFLGQTSGQAEMSLETLNPETLSYPELFGLTDDSSTPLVWGIPGSVPSLALESDSSLAPDLDSESVAKLVEQTRMTGGKLVLRSSDASLVSEQTEPLKLLLLGTAAESLPPLASGVESEAIVLSSPFEKASSQGATHLRPSKLDQLRLEQNRLFDAVLLSAIPPAADFEGLTIRRDETGKFQPKTPTLYRWTNQAWLPQFDETGKTP